MNRIVLAMLVPAAIVLLGFTTQDSAKTNAPQVFNAADEAAVRGVLNDFVNSWNQHDMKAMHDLDTEDVEWINVNGHYWQGKSTVYKGHTAIHKGMFAKQSMSVESATVRSIAPAVAVVVATQHFSASSDPRYPWVLPAKTRGSYIMVKRDGVWKIAHFQNTLINPKTENDDLPKYDVTGFPPPSNP